MSKAHIPPAVAIRDHTTLIGKKEKLTHKRADKKYVAEVFIHSTLVISDVCNKFQNSWSSSSREIFDDNFHMHYLGVRDGKRKNRKRRQN